MHNGLHKKQNTLIANANASDIQTANTNDGLPEKEREAFIKKYKTT